MRVGIAVIVALSLALLGAASLVDAPADVVLFLAGSSIFTAGTGWYLVRWLRSTAEAHRHQYQLCIRCGYPLTGLGSAGDCPECGAAFDRADAEAYWRRRLDPDHDAES